MFYTVFTGPDAFGNREKIGSFRREEEAIVAAHVWPDSLVLEKENVADEDIFPDFGRFHDWVASTHAYDAFFEEFLAVHRNDVWKDDEDREEDFLLWWYNL